LILVTLLQDSQAMATTPQIPPPNPQQPPHPGAVSAAQQAVQNLAAQQLADAAAEQALVPVLTDPELKVEGDDLEVSGALALLPIELDVAIPVRNFRVRELLALEPGHLIETQWHNGDDVPLAAANVQLAWSEFEVIETEMAVRVTRLP
jgi:flagellar motor switch protein FliN/FliY